MNIAEKFITKKNTASSRIYVFFLLVYISSLYPPDLHALDPGTALTGYHVRSWTIKEGLPHNTITALWQSHDGYIWIGTPAGLVRFDGVRFTIYNRKNTPVLKSDYILSLYEDAQKVLWLGTAGGGFYSLTNGTWHGYTTSDGLSNNQVRAIIMDWEGNLWLGTDYGLNRFKSGQFRVFTKDDGLDDNIITALCLDFQGHLWIGTLAGGLASFKDNRFTIFNYKNGLLNAFIFSLANDQIGNIWIGTQQGLFYYSAQQGIITPSAGISYTPVTALINGQKNSLWIGTMADGLKRIYRSQLSGISSEQGFPDDYIHCLIQDREGHLWAGTESEGLLQLKETMITNITRANGLPENAVCTIIEDQQNTLWAGMIGTGLCQIKNGKFQQLISTKSGLSSNYIRTLFKDSNGRLWIGTEGGGINLFHSGRITHLTDWTGTPAYTISAICQDRKGDIWFGSDQGLAVFRDGKIETQNRDSVLIGSSIQVLLPSSTGMIYIGTRMGLFTFHSRSLQRVRTDSSDIFFDIKSLYEDSNGALWIGTNGDGIIRRNNQQCLSITTEHGLPDNHIFSINEDAHHNFWFSSDNGVFMIRRWQLEEFCNRSISILVTAWYDQAQGMISHQCSRGCQPGGALFSSGQLYYPTARGICIFDISKIDTPLFTTEPILENIQCDKENIPIVQPVTIPFPCDILEINFTAFDYTAPEKIHFQYQLQGFDDDFIPVFPGADRIARYFRLPAGHYNFVVRTAVNGGKWHEAKTLIEFEIHKPFYRTFGFYLGASLLSTGLLFLAFLFINKQKKNGPMQIKYKTMTLDPERIEGIVQKLHHGMEKDRIYLNPDLSLTGLAQQLHIHQNHLSRIINERFGLNFNDYINKYRIQEICRRFTLPEDKEKTILELMYECGFYSKSVFNTAFKKFTGRTPSEFRKEPAKQGSIL